MLSASPGWTQTCTEAEIKANIAKFKDIDNTDEPPYQNVIRCQQDAIQSLIATVQNKQNNAELRRRAAYALGDIGQGTFEDVKVLVRVVGDQQDDTDVRRIVAEVIGEIEKGTLEDVQILLGVVKDKQDNERVRGNAALALKGIGKGTPEDVKTLVEVVKDKQDDARVRGIAASAIEAIELGTLEDIKTLVEVVEDKQDDARVRANTASAVGEIGLASPEDVQVLLRVVEDEQDSRRVRANAASALGRIEQGTLEDVKVLVRIIEDQKGDVRIRRNAAYSIAEMKEIELGTPEIVKALLRVVNDKQDDTVVRLNAASAVGGIGLGTLEDVKVLVRIIEDQQDNVRVRANAASALSKIEQGTLEDVKVLVRVIENQQDDVRVRMNAAWAAQKIGVGTSEDVKALLKVLKNREDDERVRGNAASAVGKIGVGTPEDVKALLKILKNQQDDANVRSIAASAVEKSEQSTLAVIKALLEVVQDKQDDANVRNQAGFALEDISSKFIEEKDNLSIQKLEQWIELFTPVLEVQDVDEKMQNEIRTDINTLERILQDKKESQKIRQLLQNSGFAILVHALFWTGLIFLYPKSSQVQAIFFWNPKVRKIIGLWYIDLALTWIPFLRSKLFEPFRESLLSDADLESFNSQAYFTESPVKHKIFGKIKPLNQAIPEIQGQIVLEGESGLGKSFFLRHLVQSSERIVVYIPAKKCDAGVMAAIQAKLHGYVKEDPNFLQSLIYSGAIDICIDGLNEVTPDTRAKITSFVESNFKGNIIMTTQPIDWTPPSTSTPKIYILQPLTDDQIKQFLLSRTEFLTEATVTEEAYKQACQNYLTEI